MSRLASLRDSNTYKYNVFVLMVIMVGTFVAVLWESVRQLGNHEAIHRDYLAQLSSQEIINKKNIYINGHTIELHSFCTLLL